MKKILAGLALILVTMGVAAADEHPIMATNNKPLAADNIVVKTPQIQLVQNGATSAKAFMELDNKGNLPQILIAANSMTATQTLLHKVVGKDSKRIKRVNKIVIKGHDDVELAPGGFHVFLMGLKQTLHKGDSVPVLLIFEDGSSITVHAVVS